MDEEKKTEVENTEELDDVIEEVEVAEEPTEETMADDLAAFIEAAEEEEPEKELKPMDITPIDRNPSSDDDEEKTEEVEVWSLEDQNGELMPEDMSRPEIDQRMEKKQNESPRPKKQKKKTKAAAIVIPIVAVLVLIFAYAGFSLYQTKKSVETLKTNAEDFLTSVQSKDSFASKENFDKLRASTKKIDDILDSPLFKVIAVVPKVKKELDVAKDLVELADDAEENFLAPLVEKMQLYPLTDLKVGDGFNVILMNEYLDLLEEKQEYLEELLAKLDTIDPDTIIGGYINEKKEKINELVDSYHEALELLPLLRVLIGDGSDRLYILAAQNSAEIRASGGFPGSMGTIRIKDGILTIGDFKSVYDMLNNTPSDDSGLDSEDRLFGSYWLSNPWDSCFIPDFSKTARVWATAYRDMRWEKRYKLREKEAQEAIKREERKAQAEANGEEFKEEIPESDCVPEEFFDDYDYYMAKFHIDGVVSMTPAIIQMMLEEVGEIELSDGTKMDATNSTRVLQHEIYMKYFSLENMTDESGWRSDLMFSETAKTVMKKFLGKFEIGKFSYYYKLLKSGIDQHIINIWMEDPEEQKIVEEANAAGALSYNENDPFTGIYFSSADPCKLGWYLDITPQISEPVENPDGSKTYDVTVELTNTLTYEETRDFSWYIIGKNNGSIYAYVHFLAPAGGSLDNIYADSRLSIMHGTYHGLDLAYSYSLYIDPQETITVHYQVTTAPGVEAPLRAVTTPTLTAYRN